MISEPKIEQRSAQGYLAIRTQFPMVELPSHVDKLFPELSAWLRERSIDMSGAPFIRYYSFNDGSVDLEVGAPVAGSAEGDGRVGTGTLPAGRYATLTHTGHYSGLMDANVRLADWAKGQGLAPEDEEKCHLESYLTNPREEPDSAKWVTIVSFLISE